MSLQAPRPQLSMHTVLWGGQGSCCEWTEKPQNGTGLQESDSKGCHLWLRKHINQIMTLLMGFTSLRCQVLRLSPSYLQPLAGSDCYPAPPPLLPRAPQPQGLRGSSKGYVYCS